jgi:hypothetical protein
VTIRPIIFSAPMVLALLDGKTQTRRIIPEQSLRIDIASETAEDLVLQGWHGFSHGDALCAARLPYAVGDLLWVREACRAEELRSGADGIRTRADHAWRGIPCTREAGEAWLALYTYRGHSGSPVGPWVPPIHMPRSASRLTLRVTDVRVQRLQEISEEDAAAEGLWYCDDGPGAGFWYSGPDMAGHVWGDGSVECFSRLWNEIHGPDAWASNPWVAAISFDVIRANVDEVA